MEKTIFKNDNFTFVEVHGIGTENTRYAKLEVKSKGLAHKHVVDISLDSDWQDFNGAPVHYHYITDGTYVNHGMRMKNDTLDETLEYAAVLKDAVKFAKRVNKWILAHPEWKYTYTEK